MAESIKHASDREQDIWSYLLYRSRVSWPDRHIWLDQVRAWYHERPLLKPDCWDESVHTTIQYHKPCDLATYASLSRVPLSLVDVITPHLEPAATWFGIADMGRFEIQEIWYNAYRRRQYQGRHRHGGGVNMLSGVYYASYRAGWHTATRFYHPGFEWDFDAVRDHPMLFHQPNIDEGDIIIFPSELGHDVPRQDHDDLRVTVSFNVKCHASGSLHYD